MLDKENKVYVLDYVHDEKEKKIQMSYKNDQRYSIVIAYGDGYPLKINGTTVGFRNYTFKHSVFYNYDSVPLKNVLAEVRVVHKPSLNHKQFVETKDDNKKIEMMGISFLDIFRISQQFVKVEKSEQTRIYPVSKSLI